MREIADALIRLGWPEGDALRMRATDAATLLELEAEMRGSD